MTNKCTSCGKEVKMGFSQFSCPGCGKTKIFRCEDCRALATGYSCGCGFRGP